MYDALFLPSPAPTAYDAAAGYIESPGISHHWSGDDWRRAIAGGARFLLPIAGCWPPFGDGRADALAQRARLDAFGFPRGCARALDVEHAVAAQAVDSGYVGGWAHTVSAGGDYPLVYSSATDAGRFGGMALWLAHWTNVPHQEPGAVATQYASPASNGSLNVDESLVADGVPLYDVRPEPPNGGKPVPGSRAVAIIAHPSGRGYWEVAADGAVFAYGAAKYHGGANTVPNLAAPITGGAAAPDGNGYWLVGADFGVFAYGSAGFYGSAATLPHPA